MRHESLIRTGAPAVLALVAMSLLGCGPLWRPAGLTDSWLDPSKPVHKPSQAEVFPINTSVGALDEYDRLFPNAEPPRIEDLQWSEAEYRIGPGDVLNITVLDLPRVGLERTVQKTVEQSGLISLPHLDERVDIGGLTVQQAREAIEDAYSPDILLEPEVTVNLIAQRQNVYHILGAVVRPGPYDIVRRKFTILEALARAGDVTQANVDYVYVYRPTEAREQLQQSEARAPGVPAVPGVEPISDDPNDLPPLPGEQEQDAQGSAADAVDELRGAMGEPEPLPATPTTQGAPEEEPVLPAMLRMTDFGRGAAAVAAAGVGQDGEAVWVFRDGQWVEVPADAAETPATPQTPRDGQGDSDLIGPRVPSVDVTPEPRAADAQAWRRPNIPARQDVDEEDVYNWMQADLSHLARVIVIDLNKLKEGDPSQNIVIQDGDVVYVPSLDVGEFYVAGEVNRPGVYSLTGREITVKQAIAAAGGLGPLAWPSNAVLTRRVSDGEELQHPLNLDLIMSGRAPEILLKPNDVISVGTHAAAPFLAVMRNAFRMTYGFGFIYDRNYAEQNFGQFVEIDSFFRP